MMRTNDSEETAAQRLEWLTAESTSAAGHDAEELARPFLQGLILLHDVGERADAMSWLAEFGRDDEEKAHWRTECSRQLAAVRRACEIVSRFADGCVSPGTQIGYHLRPVMEAIAQARYYEDANEAEDGYRILYPDRYEL
jgi:hypothetical protein